MYLPMIKLQISGRDIPVCIFSFTHTKDTELYRRIHTRFKNYVQNIFVKLMWKIKYESLNK